MIFVVSRRLLRITVVSSPSPKPICGMPLDHPVSSNTDARQAVPWSVPSSRYFQTAFVWTRVTVAAWLANKERTRRPTLRCNRIRYHDARSERREENATVDCPDRCMGLGGSVH